MSKKVANDDTPPCRDDVETDTVRSDPESELHSSEVLTPNQLPEVHHPYPGQVLGVDVRWLCQVGLGCVCGEGCDE